MDIATGYFEIGGLLELDGKWQNMDNVRILLGAEVTNRTRNVLNQVNSEFVDVVSNRLDKSIDDEKERNEFLLGIPSILTAMQQGKIECRVIDNLNYIIKSDKIIRTLSV